VKLPDRSLDRFSQGERYRYLDPGSRSPTGQQGPLPRWFRGGLAGGAPMATC